MHDKFLVLRRPDYKEILYNPWYVPILASPPLPAPASVLTDIDRSLGIYRSVSVGLQKPRVRNANLG